MWHKFCKAKFHRLKVTEADLNYTGSITIDAAILAQGRVRPYEMVQITSLASGIRWVTYCIPAPQGSGTVCLNGPAARHFTPGDLIVVLAFAYCLETEIEALVSQVIFVDGENRITQVESYAQASWTTPPG